jgi:hypothetical protein
MPNTNTKTNGAAKKFTRTTFKSKVKAHAKQVIGDATKKTERVSTEEFSKRAELFKGLVGFGADLIGKAYGAVVDVVAKGEHEAHMRGLEFAEKCPEEYKASRQHEREMERRAFEVDVEQSSALGKFFGVSYVKWDDLAVSLVKAAGERIVEKADLPKLFEAWALSKLGRPGTEHEEKMLALSNENLRMQVELLKQQQAAQSVNEATATARLAIDRAEVASRMAQSAKDMVTELKNVVEKNGNADLRQ